MYISGDYFNNIATVLIYERNYFNNYIKLYKKNIIYVNEENLNVDLKKIHIFITKVEWVNYFIKIILPKLQFPFIFITHYSDLSSGNSMELLNNNLLIKWYGQNMNIIHNKVEGIPIGLENKYWQRVDFKFLQKSSRNLKTKLLYINFSLKTNIKRNNILTVLHNKKFLLNNNVVWHKYIADLSAYKFCICPEGNGIDSHRIWECLYLNVIPIVENSIALQYFKNLPILYVDSYNIITKKYLDEIYLKFKNKYFKLDEININYWKKKISIYND